jgi:hypothetical protein
MLVSTVSKHAVAIGDLCPEGLHERRLANSRKATQQNASPARAPDIFHRGAKFGELMPSANHSALNVK